MLEISLVITDYTGWGGVGGGGGRRCRGKLEGSGVAWGYWRGRGVGRLEGSGPRPRAKTRSNPALLLF